MKRKAVLIANTNGLEGVQVDVTRFSNFLKSSSGGSWYDSEIDIVKNDTKSNLLRKIDTLKNQSYDYLVVLFSGHGGQKRQTVLEINRQGEQVEETLLRNLASRQLNIYDCCRVLSPEMTKSATDSLSASFSESVNLSRQRYDDRIMQASRQQILLYSCSVGQVSYDTPNGGIYLSSLIKAAQKIDNNERFKLVSLAHETAKTSTILSSLNENQGTQIPEAVLPKCLSEQQLIISMA